MDVRDIHRAYASKMETPAEWTPLMSEKFIDVDGNANMETAVATFQKTVYLRARSNLQRQWQRNVTTRKMTSLVTLAPLVLLGAGIFLFCPANLNLFHHERHGTSEADQKPSFIGAEMTTLSNYSCLPTQACWPTSSIWGAFNQSIAGNLKLTVPWAAPCYLNDTSPQCQQVESAYMNEMSRSSQYGTMQFLDWEACGSSDCILNSFAPNSPVTGSCSLGRLSSYYVEAHCADDISKTLNFVKEHNIRVSIKNTGHDYFGRSNAANSLAIWTHNMKDRKYYDTFTPKGCKTQYKDVGEVGAGVQAQEASAFFERFNMLVTVGAVGSVGIAGGFGQGGGHGPLGPSYGLMVDQAIEFDVVTADGHMRTINECTDPDLFWALRGGGGGTYAVLVSYRFQLHRAVPINVYSFQASFSAPDGVLDITESKVHHDIVAALARNQTSFAQHGIAGYNFIRPNGIVSLQVLPSSDPGVIKSVTSQWHEFLSSYPGLNVSDNSYYMFPEFSQWHDFTEQSSIASNGPVGLGLVESGRFIPKHLFSTEGDIQQLTDAVLTAMQFSYTNRGGGNAQLYSTGPSNQPDSGAKTSANPAWRDSLWEVIMGGIWTMNTPANARSQVQNTISAAIQPFKALTPGGGCYMNEGDWQEENWQQTFFGSNYDKLLAIKQKYDPTGLFNCWKCVGWTGYDDPMYSCYTQTRKNPNPSVPLGPVA